MKKTILPLLTLLVFASCAKNDEMAENNNGSSQTIDGIIGQVTPMAIDQDGEDVVTRSTLTFDSSKGMVFAWEASDQMTIYPDAAQGNNGTFGLRNEGEEAGKSSAHFTGTGFTLTAGATYYAFSKSAGTVADKSKCDFDGGVTNLKMTYSGQVQSANDNTEHLGKFDYMAAVAQAVNQDEAVFTFKHLGYSVLFEISFPADFTTQTFTKLTLYEAGKNDYTNPIRSINLTGFGTDASAFTPAWNTATTSDERLYLQLGEDGFEVKNGETLKLYMELPPYNFTGKTLVCHLKNKSADNKDYYFTITNKNFRSGYTYWFKPTAEPCTQYKINVQVVQNWQNDNVQVQTRANGDPGTTETLELPKYLYAYFVNAGNVVQTATASDIATTDWVKADDGIYNFNGNWTFAGDKKPDDGTTLALDNSYGTDPKVYIIASDAALTLPSVTLGSSPESDIQAFTYSYADQTQMKNLYSTPYVDGTAFTGYLSEEYKDVKLYHVASKVDINWESASKLSGSVSVNDFQTSGLSYFLPTTGNTGTGSGSVSTTIDKGNQYNGRAYWYLPQPASATYNVTIGSKTSDITFTRNDVYTSWFRGNVTVQ